MACGAKGLLRLLQRQTNMHNTGGMLRKMRVWPSRNREAAAQDGGTQAWLFAASPSASPDSACGQRRRGAGTQCSGPQGNDARGQHPRTFRARLHVAGARASDASTCFVCKKTEGPGQLRKAEFTPANHWPAPICGGREGKRYCAGPELSSSNRYGEPSPSCSRICILSSSHSVSARAVW